MCDVVLSVVCLIYSQTFVGLRCFLFKYVCLNCKTRSQQADNVLSSCVRGLMTHLLYVLAHALDCCCPQAPPVSVSQQRLTPAALVACPHQKQQRDCTHSRWVSKHAKKRDPCCDVGKPSTELNKCTNSNQVVSCFAVTFWAFHHRTTGHIQLIQLKYNFRALLWWSICIKKQYL